MPPPRPPSVNAGRTTHGSPTSGSAASACFNPTSTFVSPAPVTPAARAASSSIQPLAIALLGIRSPALAIASRNSSRSSAHAIAS